MDYTLLNVTLELLGTVMLLILIAFQLAQKDRAEHLNRIFLTVLCLNTLIILLDAVSWLVDGRPGAFFRFLGWSSNFLVFVFGLLTIFFLLLYVAASIPLSLPAQRRVGGFFLALVVLFSGIMAASLSSGAVFSIDEHNVYSMGPQYWLAHLCSHILFIAMSVLILLHRKKLGIRKTLALLSYAIIPQLSMVVNYAFPDLMLPYLAMALALLIIFVNIQLQRDKVLKEREVLLLENRIAIMKSQIQPHFLYNSLTTVGDLCATDPKQAHDAVLEFSSYLRANLDSLSQRGLVPFEKELQHVTNYLSLEKRRFEERLQVVYAIGPTDFDIPALSLQPIVENAVLHGVTSLKKGGCVRIGTQEQKKNWVITVQDDGTGFDAGRLSQSGTGGTGIGNVRARLWEMCRGTLTVQSAPGSGTTVEITVPKFK